MIRKLMHSRGRLAVLSMLILTALCGVSSAFAQDETPGGQQRRYNNRHRGPARRGQAGEPFPDTPPGATFGVLLAH